MTDCEGSDAEFDGFQGLKLKSPSQPDGDFFNKPLDVSKNSHTDHDETSDWFGDSESPSKPKNFEPTFSGVSFGAGASLFGKTGLGGFGESSESDDDDDVGDSEDVKNEEFVGLDWDANTIFKSLACIENDQEKGVCVLRLHDILAKSEMAIQKMTRQMIHCGNRIQKYNEVERRDLGFSDEHNLKTLRQSIYSLRACSKLMLIETEDLQEVLQPTFRPEELDSSRLPVVFLLSGMIAVPVAIYFFRRLAA